MSRRGLGPRLYLCLYRSLNKNFERGFPGGSVVKNPPANAGDAVVAGWIPRSGRSPGEGNFGSLLQ